MIVTTCFEPEEIERVDALAQERGVTREEMLAALVLVGVSTCEREAVPPASERRLTVSAS